MGKLHTACVPETGSQFIRFFLGQVNVKQYREGERYVLKKEYEKFKNRTSIIFLVAVIVQMLFPINWLQVLFQVWLLYYYVSLALRENILRVNGSAIMPWWIIHHYFSIILSLVFLLWPSSEAYEKFNSQFLRLGLVQASVQLLANRYHQSQLYKQIAIGKASRMDVTGEAVSPPNWTPSANLLLPFLLFFQTYQIYNAALLVLHSYDIGWQKTEWQQILAAGILGILGVGNLIATFQTYYRKSQQQRYKAQ